MGFTEASGCCVGKYGSQSTGSTEAKFFFYVSIAGGRPISTTEVKGFGVGLSGGVYASTQSCIFFQDDMELPSEWDTSIETVKDDDKKCSTRIM